MNEFPWWVSFLGGVLLGTFIYSAFVLWGLNILKARKCDFCSREYSNDEPIE